MKMYINSLIEPDQLYPLIGRNIRRFRRQHDMTQEQLAEQIDGDQKMISKIEAGKARPGLSLYLRIANVFHVSIDHFLEDAMDSQLSEITDLPLLPTGPAEKELTQDVLRAVLMYLQKKDK